MNYIDSRENTFFHEAGHLIINIIFGVTVYKLIVYKTLNQRYDGKVRNDYISIEEKPILDIIIRMAGVAAEFILIKKNYIFTESNQNIEYILSQISENDKITIEYLIKEKIVINKLKIFNYNIPFWNNEDFGTDKSFINEKTNNKYLKILLWSISCELVEKYKHLIQQIVDELFQHEFKTCELSFDDPDYTDWPCIILHKKYIDIFINNYISNNSK